MTTIRAYQKGDEQRMREIAPRAFGVWARLGIDKTLPNGKRSWVLKERPYPVKKPFLGFILICIRMRMTPNWARTSRRR